MRTISKEIPKRGPLGWVILTVFLVFNVLMIFELVRWLYELSIGESDWEVGKFLLLGIVWPLGATCTGVAALLTRTTVVHEQFE